MGEEVVAEREAECGATAASCLCDEPQGHDGPHKCADVRCFGEWYGNDLTGDKLIPVRLPTGGEVNMQNAISGLMRVIGY